MIMDYQNECKRTPAENMRFNRRITRPAVAMRVACPKKLPLTSGKKIRTLPRGLLSTFFESGRNFLRQLCGKRE